MQQQTSQFEPLIIQADAESNRMAYIKPVEQEGETVYAVHAADGTPLALFESMEDAFFTVRRHNLLPVQLH